MLKEEKTLAQIASEYKLSTSVVSKWKNIMVKNIEKVFEDNKSKDLNQKKEYEKQIDELYQEIGKLTTQLNWLKKNVVSQLSLVEKRNMIELNDKISIRKQCQFKLQSMKSK